MNPMYVRSFAQVVGMLSAAVAQVAASALTVSRRPQH